MYAKFMLTRAHFHSFPAECSCRLKNFQECHQGAKQFESQTGRLVWPDMFPNCLRRCIAQWNLSKAATYIDNNVLNGKR